MQLELSYAEVDALLETLKEYLPSLRREVNRTDRRDLRHDLVVKLDVCEALIKRLEALHHEHA